jgi:glycosyltransferase involved in cell wall biosynthesis
LREQFSLPNNQTIILFLGRLHPVKGLDYLIPALGKLTDRQFTFVLAGSGDKNYESHLQKLIIDSGIADRTKTIGFTTGYQKDLLLQGSDLFAMTSHQENFGIAALEAMAAGLTVVTTPGVALSSIIQEHLLGCVCNLDITSISQAIGDCLDNLDVFRNRGQIAAQLVKKEYTWVSHAKKLSQIYQDVLNDDSRMKKAA